MVSQALKVLSTAQSVQTRPTAERSLMITIRHASTLELTSQASTARSCQDSGNIRLAPARESTVLINFGFLDIFSTESQK